MLHTLAAREKNSHIRKHFLALAYLADGVSARSRPIPSATTCAGSSKAASAPAEQVGRDRRLVGLQGEQRALGRDLAGAIADKELQLLTLAPKQRQKEYAALVNDPKGNPPPAWQLKAWLLGAANPIPDLLANSDPMNCKPLPASPRHRHLKLVPRNRAWPLFHNSRLGVPRPPACAGVGAGLYRRRRSRLKPSSPLRVTIPHAGNAAAFQNPCRNSRYGAA